MKSQIRVTDYLSILISSICLIHCLLPPLLIITGLGFFFEQEGSKYIFITVSFIAIFHALKDAKSIKIATLLWSSFWIFLFSLFFQEEYNELIYTSYLGSVGIILGHILNIKNCQKCQKK